jgi:hypothetical protein
MFDAITAVVPVSTAFLEIAVGDARLRKRHASSSLNPLLRLLRQIAMRGSCLENSAWDVALWQICITDRQFSSQFGKG